MEDLSEASLEDVATFFATFYTPDNAVLSIAGDFDRAEAMALVERYFGPIPAGRRKPALPPMELPPTFGQPLREVVEDDVALPRLLLAFRSPVFGSPDYYVASVTGAILGMGKGSRLNRTLVRERQVAASAHAFTFDLSKGSDLLVVDATARPGISADQLEREVGMEIDRLHAGGVTQGEVERAVALIETSVVAALQSAGERADQLSKFATYLGDPTLVNEQAERHRRVTAADVTRFARERLGPDNRAALLYVPRDESLEADASADEASQPSSLAAGATA
jgi:predicted Zn-dependent peptidase